LAIVLLGRVTELKIEALLEFTNLVIKSVRLKNTPLKHLVFEELELDRQEPVIAFKSLLRLAIVLLGRVTELKIEALLEFTNLVIKSVRLKNTPLKHLVFEELELDRQEPGKLVVGKSGVDKQVLD
nr:hypothetical protein [Tanacetum cinerariifolium]